MTNLSSNEELKECRDRVNPVKDATLMFSKSGVCDEYTATVLKVRKNEREKAEELANIEKEFAL